MKKTFLLLLLVIALTFCLFPASSSADMSGQCGDDLTWIFSSSTGTLTINGTGNMYDYKSEEDQPWKSVKQQITAVSLPQGLTRVGDYAFYRCLQLTSVDLPDTVASIGRYAFSWCSLTSLEFPNSVTDIGLYAFYGGNRISTLTIPKSVVHIDRVAFSWLTELSAIEVEPGNEQYEAVDGVLFTKDKKEIVTYPSGKRDSSYSVPDGVELIQRSACCANPYLTSVSIPGTVATIGMQSFADCQNLKQVTIGNGVSRIGHYSFTNCSLLSSVTIPASVSFIYGSAFAGCSGLLSYCVDEDNQNYMAEDGILYSKDKSTLVAYPNGQGGGYCSVPSGVTDIGQFAFASFEGLRSVALPVTVSCVEQCAFLSCSNLREVVCEGAEVQREEIKIEENNDALLKAAWHYAGVMVDRPAILDQPKDVTVQSGVSVTFTVQASGEGELIYQWYGRKTKADDPWMVMEGANTETLTIADTKAYSGWVFRCAIQGTNGTIYSDTVTLKVTP